jgi:hypothetical protein
LNLKPWHWLLIGAAGFTVYRLFNKWELWEKLDFSLSQLKPGISRQGVYIDAVFSLNNKTAENLTINRITGDILYKNQKIAALLADQPQTIQPGVTPFVITIRPTLGGTVDIIKKALKEGAQVAQDFWFVGAVTVENITVNVKNQLTW